MRGGLHLRTQAADDGLVDGEFWPPRRPLQHLAVLDDSIPEVFIELQKTCTHIDNNRKVSLDTAARGRLRQNTGRSPLSLSTVPPVALATPGAQGPLLSSLRIRHLTGPRASSVRCPPAQRAADVQCRDGGLPPCPPRTPHSSPRPERGRARRGRASTHPWIKLSHCCLRTDGGRLPPRPLSVQAEPERAAAASAVRTWPWGQGTSRGDSCPSADSWETSGSGSSTLKCHGPVAIQERPRNTTSRRC